MRDAQRTILFFVFVSVLTIPQLRAQELKINEIMASHSTVLADEDGDFPDWLELYNDSENPVSLERYGLSDRRDQLLQWRFPATTIQPGGYLLVFASGKDRAAAVSHWETVIDWGDEWKYSLGSAELSSDWNQPGFNDSAWATGPTGIGYGDGDDATQIAKTISVFARRTFYLDTLRDILTVLLHIDYDDGFVAYLNGTEIARSNLATGDDGLAWNSPASPAREATIKSGGQPDRFEIENFATLLQEGQNLLAIEVHNISSSSSDLSLIPFLTLGLSSPPPDGRGSPEILQLKAEHLHCNFKIKAAEEMLFLTAPDGRIIDEQLACATPVDVSWGRYPDGGAEWVYFDSVTPGLPNAESRFTSIAPVVGTSLPSGFYQNAQQLQLTADTAVTIFYSMDGSVPDTSSEVYTDPITISQTTVVRARAFGPGQLPGEIVTHSYFIDEDLNLPVVSLVTDPANLWDPETGIYVEGSNGIPGYCSSSPKNWNQDWERPATLEFFEPDGRRGFAIRCGIKIGGGCTRKYDQKSIAVYTRSQYGDTKINYRVFPDKPLLQYNNLMLRNGGQDWYRASIRDGMMQNLVRDRMDLDCQAFRSAILFLNGEYWGIHNLREKHNEHYLANNHGIDPDAIDILYANAGIKQGSSTHYDHLINYLKDQDIRRDEMFRYVKTQMDIDEYINYQIAEIYFANIDWPGGNIKYWRPQTADGKWRWILFDLDLGFGAHPRGQYDSNTLENATASAQIYYANPPWSTYLFRRLLQNESFRNEFIQRYCAHMSTTFAPDRVLNVIDSLKTLIEPQVDRHREKWPASLSLGANWYEHIGILREFARQRSQFARDHMAAKFDLAGYADIRMVSENPEMGEIVVNSVAIPDSGATLSLAKEIPFHCSAVAYAGYHFTGWKGLTTQKCAEIEMTVSDSGSLVACFSAGETSGLSPRDAPAQFRLFTNYPNPFNPVTNIAYQVPRDVYVNLSIYDLTGRRLETLVAERKNPGKYVVQWKTETQPSGMYLYMITASDFREVRKCILLK